MRLLLAGLLGLALVSTAGAQRSFEEAVLPLPQYRAADARALAEAHAPELRRLYDDVRRCVPSSISTSPGSASGSRGASPSSPRTCRSG